MAINGDHEHETYVASNWTDVGAFPIVFILTMLRLTGHQAENRMRFTDTDWKSGESAN